MPGPAGGGRREGTGGRGADGKGAASERGKHGPGKRGPGGDRGRPQGEKTNEKTRCLSIAGAIQATQRDHACFQPQIRAS
jgi:hypothetical protein